jgi:hypothetical protein
MAPWLVLAERQAKERFFSNPCDGTVFIVPEPANLHGVACI